VLDVVSLTVPIFLLIALGFGAVQWRLVPADFVSGLGSFVLNFALPALILHALLRQDLRETFNWSYLIAYSGGSLSIFVIVLLFFRCLLARDLTYAAVGALGAVAANSGFIGFPVAMLAIGTPALTALPLSMLVENALVIPLSIALAEIGHQHGKPLGTAIRQTLLRLSRMPLILAIVFGMGLSASGLHPPAVLATAVEMLADASVACALFVVGGTLAGTRLTALGGDVFWIMVGKLVLHPLAVGTGLLLLGNVPAPLAAAGILFACAPMITIYPVIGQRFGLGGLCAAALLVTTAAGLVTMTAVLGVIGIAGS
jgi:malonate transporter and related proteins